MTGPDQSPDMFALGSSQYAGIYMHYKAYQEVSECFTYREFDILDSMETFFEEIIPHIYEEISDRAKLWEEEPELERWESLNLKLKLLLAKEEDTWELSKRMFEDYFNLMKSMSWDLWSVLNAIGQQYPELSEFLEDNRKVESDSSREWGLMLFFFAHYLKLTDDEVIEIFGDFDT